jgi:shikimate kinase
MNLYQRIFIIGHSGAGKGVFAQALAKKLNWKFIDADFSLAPSMGRPLIEILGDTGEKKFIHCLSDILAYQLTQENVVVTTDDSIVCCEKNRQLLSQEFTVYLQANTTTLMERISHNRPLLPTADFPEFLNQLHEERDKLYEQASRFSISSDDGNIDQHVAQTLNAMNSK